MLLFLVLGLLLGALVVIFALQNVAAITVTFLVWQIEGSLALIMLIAVLAGALISVFLSIPEIIQNHRNVAKINRKNAELESELRIYKDRDGGNTVVL